MAQKRKDAFFIWDSGSRQKNVESTTAERAISVDNSKAKSEIAIKPITTAQMNITEIIHDNKSETKDEGSEPSARLCTMTIIQNMLLLELINRVLMI